MRSMHRTAAGVIVGAICFWAPGSFAIGQSRNVPLLESAVAQLEVLIQTATECANVYAAITDATSADVAINRLAKVSEKFRTDLIDTEVLVQEAKKQLASARTIRSPELQARIQAAVAKAGTLDKTWRALSATCLSEIQRVYGLTDLSEEFWQTFEPEYHRIALAAFATAKMRGEEVPAEFETQVRETLSAYEHFGYANVAKIKLGAATDKELKAAVQTLKQSLPATTSLISGVDLAGKERLLIVVPISSLSELQAKIDFGKVVRVDGPQRVIVVRPKSAAITPEEIEAAIQMLTDNGAIKLELQPFPVQLPQVPVPSGFPTPKLAQPQDPGRVLDGMRTLLREVGTEGILTLDLVGPTIEQLYQFLPFWQDVETGQLIYATRNRVYLLYRDSLDEFTNQLKSGEVESVDEEKRRLRVKIDPEKISPHALLKYENIWDDPKRESQRAKLQSLVTLDRLNALAAKQGTKISTFTSVVEETPEERSARFRRESEARMESFRLEVESRRNRGAAAGQAGRGNGAARPRSVIQRYELGEFRLPAPGNSLTLEEIREVVDLLYYKGHIHHEAEIRKGALKVLLRVPNEDVPDRETLGRIAKGIRELASKSFLPDEVDEAVVGLVKWGGKYSAPILIEMLKEHRARPSNLHIQAIASFPDVATADVLAEQLDVVFDETRAQAAAGLRRMGPFAEDALLKVAPSNNESTSLAAIELLGELGTKKSLTLLQKAGQSRSRSVREVAAFAIEQINQRLAATKE
jgi:HEAT repeat protein